MEENIILNNKEISKKEFDEKKKLIEKTQDQQLVEIQPNIYKTKIFG